MLLSKRTTTAHPVEAFRVATLTIACVSLSLLFDNRAVGQTPVEVSVEEESDEDEFGREIAHELRQAEFARWLAGERVTTLDARISWLKKVRSSHRSITALERQIESAEEQRDESKIEAIEENLREAEISGEEASLNAELAGERAELLRFFLEIPDDEVQDYRGEAKRVDALQQERIEIAKRLFKAYRSEQDSAAESLEERAEELTATFERARERLELKLELWWAEEEGEEERAEELREELGLESDAPQRSEDDSDRGPPRSEAIHVREEEILAASRQEFHPAAARFFGEHCLSCHDSGTASGDLDLEQLLATRPVVSVRETWRNVRQQIAVGSMPPSDSDRPTIESRRKLVAAITNSIDRFDYRTVASAGHEPPRRLANEEYDNAIRDLIGFDLQPTKRFPVDMTVRNGFDNNVSGLSIGPLLMERYLSAAEFTVEQVLPIEPKSSSQLEARKRLLGNGSFRSGVLTIAERAFRRPLKNVEKLSLLNEFDSVKTQTGSEIEAARHLIKVILISPSFLIKSEKITPKNQAAPAAISAHELASRLSFFLWSSIPDRSLFEAAARNRLRNAQDLDAQITRMLDDPKSTSLGDRFAVQWLGLTNLQRVQRDPIDNPWATDSLVAAMRDETAMFFHSLVREDAPIERLLDADYTYLNAELARHYGIEAELGQAMKRVSVPRERRGGLLGHGGILAITSFPHRTSPVVRGNWILGTLLGTPPPPPPPNVSEFDEELAENERLSARERLRRHRDNPNCYACHSEIDPLGFALERFDWFGRERRGRRVDDRGQFPGGKPFTGLAGLRETLLRERREDLVRQLTEKMMEYALGRSVTYSDQSAIDDIIRQVEADGRKMRTLIRAVIHSDPFQMQQVSKEAGHADPTQ